jgi:chemotaxis signal transduction protein
LLAFPLQKVMEVFRMVAIALRPLRAPRDCMGVVNCHGQLLPVFDLGARLHIAPVRSVRALATGHVVVVQDPVGRIGYAVDEVSEINDTVVMLLDTARSAALGRMTSGAVQVSDGRLVPIVDPELLLSVLIRRDLRVALEALAAAEARV